MSREEGKSRVRREKEGEDLPKGGLERGEEKGEGEAEVKRDIKTGESGMLLVGREGRKGRMRRKG